MLSSKRICNAFADARVAHGMVIALTVVVGGCSTDVTRFDFPFFGLTNKGNETGSLPTPPESVARNDRGYDDAPSAPPRGAGLGDAGRGYTPPPYTTGSSERVAGARDYGPPPGPSYAPSSERYAGPSMERVPVGRTQPRVASGDSIQVQQGDTLHGIAKRYGVSISALIEVNGLGHGTSIKPGQQLLLPAGASAPSAAPPANRTPVAVAKAPPPAAPAPMMKKGWEGQHTMKAGESLYGIARQHGVSLAELQRVNGIAEPTRVRMGTVISVPGRAEPDRAPPPAAPRVVQSSPVPPSQARIINAPNEPKGEQRTAALGDRRNDATEPAPPRETAASSKFRWPARGKVIAAFGKRADGTHNDGINIAMPQGTDVHAAESGRVAYAGNELKGYGNLVLIRHDNGWVSAYAHADQILVKRDDVVRRGQVIAKAGKTGTVDQPQLHFELRHGAKPVDPVPHMER
jgi:murein DD-endopeptidase MepM/ murein hydrolase activator NlpD